MESFKIFIVEDDPWYMDILEYHLQLNPEYEVEKYETGKECLNNLYKRPSAITLDYTLPDMKGKEVLKKIKELSPETSVIIISGQDDITTAVELLKEGAYDYIVKDEDTKDRLWNSLRNLKENVKLKQENKQLKEKIGKKYEFTKIMVGDSPAMKKIFPLIERALDNNITVSITGETGTGKELVAKAIHYNSKQKKGPMVEINVSAIPNELIESELFGHEKGAFTGANVRRIGKFEEANKGTVFLDEIAEMDMNMQTKLLRVLQERKITRIGSNKAVPIDVRLVTATHKNLTEEVKNGQFRKDLYYRLIGLPIHLPPLRERGKDILILAKYFADVFCKDNKRPKISISDEAQKKLLKYNYPGNVRELKAVIELGVIMSNDGIINAEQITFNTLESGMDFLLEEMTLEEYNKQIIKHLLDKYDGNAIVVATKLGVAKSTIYRLMRKYGLL